MLFGNRISRQNFVVHSFAIAWFAFGSSNAEAGAFGDAVRALRTTEAFTLVSPWCKHYVEKPLADAFDEIRASNVNLANEPGTKWFTGLRKVLVPFIRANPDRFGYLAESARAQMLFHSDALKAALFRNDPFDPVAGPYSSANAFPYVLIGAGVSEQTLQNQLKSIGIEKNSVPHGVTFEASTYVSKNFATKGETGNMNSSTKQSDFEAENLPGKGNLNFFNEGVLQTSDLDAQKYNSWGQLAGVATINRSFSASPIAFETKVVRVIDRRIMELPPELKGRVPDEAPPYIVIIENMNPTSTQPRFGAVFTDYVITSLGVGGGGLPPEIARESESGLLLNFKSLRGAMENSLTTYDRFLESVRSSRLGFGDVVGKSVAVWGYGDSGRTMVEWLLRRAPTKGYGMDSSQLGDPAVINWYIGKVDIDDCVKFINKNRVRYAAIADGIKSGKVKLIPGRIFSSINLNRTQLLTRIQNTKPGPITAATVDDLVISCLGYDQENSFSMFKDLADRLSEFRSANVGSVLEDVSPIKVGKRIIANNLFGGAGTPEGRMQNIVVIGPSIKSTEESELAGVAANFVSIFVNAKRIAEWGNRFFARVLEKGENLSSWCLDAWARDPIAENQARIKSYLGKIARDVLRTGKASGPTNQIIRADIPREVAEAPNPIFGLNPLFAPAKDPSLYFFFRLSENLLNAVQVLGKNKRCPAMSLRVVPVNDELRLELTYFSTDTDPNVAGAFLALLARDVDFGNSVRQLFAAAGTSVEIEGIVVTMKEGRPFIDRSKVKVALR